MKLRLQFGCAIAILTAVAFSGTAFPAPQPQQLAQSSAEPDQTPLSTEQIRDLITRVIAGQHRNDAALDTFERFEHHVEREGSANGRVIADKLYRVVPTGSGNLKLLVKESGRPVSSSDYRRQLRDWEGVLEVAVHPNDPRQVAVVAKQQKKLRDRKRLINAVAPAYLVTWLGREVRDGRVLEKIQLNPNPAYQPHGDTADWLIHARAIAWIDSSAAQLVRADAEIIRDISIGGGILGKVYRGGHFIMEQLPAAPGIWEPSLYQYDISGRKFLFGFQLHEVISLDRYRLIGSPEQALAVARENLAHCCNVAAADP